MLLYAGITAVCTFSRQSSLAKLKLCGWSNHLYFFCSLLFRCRTLSGSPRPKSFKKIHFIKNIRQHDMRNGRYEGKRGCRLLTCDKCLADNSRAPQSMECTANVSHVTSPPGKPSAAACGCELGERCHRLRIQTPLQT